jgi:hypothetical protein
MLPCALRQSGPGWREIKRRLRGMRDAGHKTLLMVMVCLIAATAPGCLVKRDSPAPGCIEYWGPAPMGGCFGKAVILDLKVEPHSECLEITVNNCNGGVLEVSNSCAEILFLNQITVHPGERHVVLDLENQNGGYVLRSTDGNFSAHVPSEDELVEIRGLLGPLEIKISFLKTKELC